MSYLNIFFLTNIKQCKVNDWVEYVRQINIYVNVSVNLFNRFLGHVINMFPPKTQRLKI